MLIIKLASIFHRMLFLAKEEVRVKNQKKFIKLLKIWFQMDSTVKSLEEEITFIMGGLQLEMNFEYILVYLKHTCILLF